MWTVELMEFLESYSWLAFLILKFLFISFLIGLSIKLYQYYIEKKALEEELGQEQKENTTETTTYPFYHFFCGPFYHPIYRNPFIYDPAYDEISYLNIYRTDDDDDYRILSEDD